MKDWMYKHQFLTGYWLGLPMGMVVMLAGIMVGYLGYANLFLNIGLGLIVVCVVLLIILQISKRRLLKRLKEGQDERGN